VAGFDPQSGRSGRKYLGITAEAWGVVGAIAAVLAFALAIWLHFSGGNAAGANKSPGIVSTTPQSARERSSPPDSLRPAESTSQQPSATTSPLPSQVSVIPPTNDPGFQPVSHRTLLVNDTGVLINSSGVYAGNAENWDMKYVPGGGWTFNGQVPEDPAFYNFTGPGTPGPAWCLDEYGSGVEESPIAEVGDQYCYVDANGVVGYLQVTSVGPNGPIVAAWFWKGPPPS
jgi:hypothetical protein